MAVAAWRGWAGIVGAVLLMAMLASPASATIRSGGATVRSGSVFMVNGGSGTVTATCPRGHRALAAGVQWRTSDGAPSTAIGRTVSALLPKNGGRACASAAIVDDPPLASRTVTADQQVTTSSIRCPTGRGVLAGGVFWTNGVGSIINTKPLGVSRPSADGLGWDVSVWGSSGSAARVVTMVFCSGI